MELSDEEKRAVEELCARVRARFGSRVSKLVLFGSRARGGVHDESDIDVCVVIDDLVWPEKHEVYGIAGDILGEHDVLISAFVLSTAQLAHLTSRERLIAREIAQDGIPL